MEPGEAARIATVNLFNFRIICFDKENACACIYSLILIYTDFLFPIDIKLFSYRFPFLPDQAHDGFH